MKKFLFFLFCCALPVTADAADIFNFNDSFNLAKAVKLGRGSAYSVAADSNVNTGTGKTEITKSCSTGCSDCDTSTGWCDACQSRYAKDNAGKCHSCPSNCASCWWEYGNTVSCETCDSGYELATNSSTGSGPFYCKKTETICLAGTYVSGTSCVDCPTGTYSSGSNADSCLGCPSGTFSSTTGASQCLPCPSEESTNGDCNASGFWCTVDWTPSSDGTSCTKCVDGTYSNGSNRPCEQCPTGCKTCKGNNLTMGADCLSCKDGYYLSDSNCVLTGSNSGSNSSSSSSGSSSSCPTGDMIGYTCVNGVKTKCLYEGCQSCANDTLKCLSCKSGYTYTAGSNCL